jgi:hypothetical protein
MFPKSPVVPAAGLDAMPAREWVVPAPSAQRRNHFSVYKVLPAGIPDCLEVHIGYSAEGAERCTAAIYGNRTYVIHYEFKARNIE